MIAAVGWLLGAARGYIERMLMPTFGHNATA